MVTCKRTARKSTAGRKKYGQLAPRQRAPRQPEVWPVQQIEEPMEVVSEEVPVPLEVINPEAEANQQEVQESEEEDPDMRYVWVNHEDPTQPPVLVPIEQMPSDVRNGGTASGYVVGPKDPSEGPEEEEPEEELSYSVDQVPPAPRARGIGGWISDSSENTEAEEEDVPVELANGNEVMPEFLSFAGDNQDVKGDSHLAESRAEKPRYRAHHTLT